MSASLAPGGWRRAVAWRGARWGEGAPGLGGLEKAAVTGGGGQAAASGLPLCPAGSLGHPARGLSRKIQKNGAGTHSVLPGPPEPGLTRAWTARWAGASHPAQSLSRHSTGAKPQTSTLGGVPGGPRTTPSPHTSLPHLGDGGAAERLDSSLDPDMSVQDCCNLLTHPCPARAH